MCSYRWILSLLSIYFVPNGYTKECGTIRTVAPEQLLGCDRLTGNLQMDGWPDMEISPPIKAIQGCISVYCSLFKNLDFLDLAEGAVGEEYCDSGRFMTSDISENPNLCVTPRIRRILVNGYKAKIYQNLPEDCHFYCPSQTFIKDYDRNLYQEVECHFLVGNFKMQDIAGSEKWLPTLNKIKEVINGSLELNNIYHDSTDMFPALTKISPLNDEPELIIRNNPNLEKVDFSKLETPPKIIVRGNRKLSQKTLDELKNWAAEGSEIQEQGECGFSSINGVTAESQLEGCSLIGSELKLETSITGKQIPHKIGHVDGCIKIEFTGLESLDFLTFDRRDGPFCNGNSVIENNKQLCLVPREERLLKELYKASISDNNDTCDNQKHCKDGTSFDIIMKDEIECTEFTGTLLMKGPFFWQKSIRSIRKINGKVILDDTALQNLDMFIDLKKLNTPNSDDYAFEIVNNAQLTDLKFSPDLPKMKIKVRGNKLLDEQSIKYLKLPATSASGSDIQEFGECPFVNNPSDLAGCKSVQKDFKLISTQITQVTENIRTVGGCIQIKNTSLTNLNFLKLEDTSNVNCPQGSEISNNKNLCILPKQKNVLETVYKATIKDNANEDCATVCDATTLERDYNVIVKNQQTCKTLKGKLVIENYAVPPQWFSLLKDVETIDSGNIVIRNNNFENFNIFPKLKEIKYNGQEPAISVTNNPNLNQFALNSITSFNVPKNSDNQKNCLIFENNGCFDWKYLCDKIDSINGCNCRVDQLDCNTSPTTTSTKSSVEETPSFSSKFSFVLVVFVSMVLCWF